MKRIILTFVAVTVMLFSADAQTKKGTVLLGAGSQFSGTEWTSWEITPKIGYFIQDGLAIGALVNFNSDDRYHPAYGGVSIPDPNSPTGWQIIGDHDDYTLTTNNRTFGVFARYYAARNLFLEVNMYSSTTQEEQWNNVQGWDANGTPVMEMQVTQGRIQETHVDFGVGYTLVWREHFAVEPYVSLDLIVDGEEVSHDNSTVDLSGTSFVAGVNFSLFF